jgi:hypothetical protein
LGHEYRSLADCSEEDFVSRERQFSEKWNAFPHHICPQKEPIIFLREELLLAGPKIQLFIPVSEMTTKEELGGRWLEVSSLQRALYGKKKRPNRKDYEALIVIYDSWEKCPKKKLARKLGTSQSSITKQYRRVYLDIHGVSPKRGLKKSARLLRRRKTRFDISAITATHGARGSEDETLRRIYIDNKLPLDKLHTPQSLNFKQKEVLRKALISGSQEPYSKIAPRRPAAR